MQLRSFAEIVHSQVVDLLIREPTQVVEPDRRERQGRTKQVRQVHRMHNALCKIGASRLSKRRSEAV